MPLAEAQAHWVADLITGRVTLPPRAEMRAQITAYDAALRKRFVRQQAAHDRGRLPRLPRRAGEGAEDAGGQYTRGCGVVALIT